LGGKREKEEIAEPADSPLAKPAKEAKPEPGASQFESPAHRTALPLSAEERRRALQHEKNKPEESAAPSGRFWTPQGESQYNLFSRLEREDSKQPASPRPSGEPLPVTPPKETQNSGFNLKKEAETLRKEKSKERSFHEEKKERPIQTPPLPSNAPIPLEARAAAHAATSFAAPYLTQETLPLFYQMAGNIYVLISQPGIATTEVLLNSPQFASSKFFGSKIEITKYSTAPDSINIRLSGTNEAVTLFNESLPDLYTALQNGNFNFRIGRIDAVYATEKPLVRRKEEGEGKQDGQGHP
jgi:hypothetical protein